jgi:D-glycero-D-manno-heptose 1,7-bisphosphate phosphatase
MKISAVFLDRDGVFNPHIPGGYLLSADDLHLLPGVARAVRRLNDAGLLVIVISNQQGVGKGLMTEGDLQAIESAMSVALKQEAGAWVDRWYYSTELASENSPRRKPKPGMLWEAAQDFGLTLSATVFAGDSATDIAAGHAAGVGRTVLLLSGGIAQYTPGDLTPAPGLVFETLSQLVDWVLEQRT